MKQIEKDELLQRLAEQQLELSATMQKSDAHASKCIKLGLDFETTYPDDLAKYEEAREQYNANEVEIARIEAIEIDVESNEENVG